MAIDRRTLLKIFSFAPALPLVGSTVVRALLANPPGPKQVFILLHGMFFLEFDLNAKKLVVATPQYDPHWFYTRLHGDLTLTNLESDPLLDVKPGQKTSFPDELLRFPASAIGRTGQILTSANAKYRCRMILPYPADILPLRQGLAALFAADTTTNVGKKLQIGNEVASMICLVYNAGASGPSVRSFYAEHAQRPRCAEVNNALAAAKGLCGNGFDLQLKSCPSVSVCTERDDELPDGVSRDDEFGLGELHGNPPCVHPLKTARGNKKGDRVRILGGDVSSCPQFGITQP